MAQTGRAEQSEPVLTLLSRALDLALGGPPEVHRRARSDARMLRQASEDLGRDPDDALPLLWLVLAQRSKGSLTSLPTLVAEFAPDDDALFQKVTVRDRARAGKRRRNLAAQYRAREVKRTMTGTGGAQDAAR